MPDIATQSLLPAAGSRSVVISNYSALYMNSRDLLSTLNRVLLSAQYVSHLAVMQLFNRVYAPLPKPTH